jgi:hypothetical protein
MSLWIVLEFEYEWKCEQFFNEINLSSYKSLQCNWPQMNYKILNCYIYCINVFLNCAKLDTQIIVNYIESYMCWSTAQFRKCYWLNGINFYGNFCCWYNCESKKSKANTLVQTYCFRLLSMYKMCLNIVNFKLKCKYRWKLWNAWKWFRHCNNLKCSIIQHLSQKQLRCEKHEA